ncbi:hypothetical protein BKH41_03225 [Helicobacter sp. 12S02232-10]|nr:hypothetical protein BKH41_03225 [Helicobacter sp. 12S02232-10]
MAQEIALPDTSQSSSQLLNCNAVFESRKNEIKEQLRELDEKNQAMEALKNATQNIFNQRETKLKERENALSLKLKEIEDKEAKLKAMNDENEAKIKNLIKKNEEVLKEIDQAKNNKLAQTYAKMKDSKAAPIIENLPDMEAAAILFSLSAQDMGKILAKMNPKKAAELTEILKKGPPFKEEKKVLPKKTQNQEIPNELSPKNEDTNTQDSSI